MSFDQSNPTAQNNTSKNDGTNPNRKTNQLQQLLQERVSNQTPVNLFYFKTFFFSVSQTYKQPTLPINILALTHYWHLFNFPVNFKSYHDAHQQRKRQTLKLNEGEISELTKMYNDRPPTQIEPQTCEVSSLGGLLECI